MAGLSDTNKDALLSLLFKKGTWSAYTALYLSLHTANPGGTGASEATYTSYARVRVDSPDAFGAVSGGTLTNTSAIEFPANTGSSQTITHWGLWTAASSGTFIAGGAISPEKVIANTVVPEFAVGDLDLSMS